MFRNENEYTVLKRPAGRTWTRNETNTINQAIKDEVYYIPSKMEAIILSGKHAKEEIEPLLADKEFELEVLVGNRNPKLPFRPPG